MADTVEGVHTEADAGHEGLHARQPGDRRQAGHVLFRRPQALLVAPHEDVGPPIDQDDRLEGQFLDQPCIGRAQGNDPHLLEGIDGRWLALLGEPLGQSALGETAVGTGRRHVHDREVGRQVFRVRFSQVRECQIRQEDLLSGPAKSNGERNPGKNVEASSGAGNEDAVVSLEPREEGRLQQRECHPLDSARAPREGVTGKAFHPTERR